MPELLKNRYNQEYINSLCKTFKSAYAAFEVAKFNAFIFDANWPETELKGRMRHISRALHHFLPQEYSAALEILRVAAPDYGGFEAMFFPDFVELYGFEHYQESIAALEYFTQFSSSEFAVRPFIIKYPEQMMAQMSLWAGSENYHVRRLASEGCRPRLPWAMALPIFKQEPEPVLKILELLKDDESEYVRRSVANNLNDISKDNPESVIEVAKNWSGHSKNTDWVVKHACRSLLKQAEPEIMALYGYNGIGHIQTAFLLVDDSVKMGASLQFSVELSTQQKKLGRLRIEYAIDFMKNNGKLSRKIFKISEGDFNSSKKSIKKRHSFKLISTRKYYAGIHRLVIIVNGEPMKSESFRLVE